MHTRCSFSCLYGLKFDASMPRHGFKRSYANHCLYTKKDEDGSPIVLILCVDDMPLAGREEKEHSDALKQQLNSAFSMKDLGEAEHILGMRIKRDRQQYMRLSQEKYIEKVVADSMWLMPSPLDYHCCHMLSFQRMIVPKMIMKPIT